MPRHSDRGGAIKGEISLWQFKNASWEQDDDAQTFRLKLLNGKECTAEPAAPLGILIGAKSHKAPRADLICSLGIFPTEFSCCPYCGVALSAIEDRPSSPWIPPYGDGLGLKILPSELKSTSMVESKGRPLAIPSMNGHFSFCVAFLGAKQRLLIALQRDIGKISIYQSGANGKWRDLAGKAGTDGLPEWSWSLATDTTETGFAIPGTDGPAWITVDWATGKLHIDRGDGRSIGGVARLGKFLLAPVLRGSSFFMLCRREGDARWSECKTSSSTAVVAPQLCRQEGQVACFGIPVVDEARMVAYWPSRGGYVKVTEASAASEHAWEFRPWETDEYPATALIELGPPYRKTGSRSGFWQLCEDHDPSRRDSVVNKIIKFDGDERVDSEALEYGQFVSTGRASFTWLYDFWNDVHQFNANAGEQSDLRYPLLQFSEKGLVLVAKVRPWQGREDMGLFSEVFFSRLEKASVYVRFVIEGAGLPERALYAEGVDGGQGPSGSLFRLSLAQLAEVSIFIYAGYIYIYLPEDNKCFGWPLEIAES